MPWLWAPYWLLYGIVNGVHSQASPLPSYDLLSKEYPVLNEKMNFSIPVIPFGIRNCKYASEEDRFIQDKMLQWQNPQYPCNQRENWCFFKHQFFEHKLYFINYLPLKNSQQNFVHAFFWQEKASQKLFQCAIFHDIRPLHLKVRCGMKNRWIMGTYNHQPGDSFLVLFPTPVLPPVYCNLSPSQTFKSFRFPFRPRQQNMFWLHFYGVFSK